MLNMTSSPLNSFGQNWNKTDRQWTESGVRLARKNCQKRPIHAHNNVCVCGHNQKPPLPYNRIIRYLENGKRFKKDNWNVSGNMTRETI